MVSWEQTGGQCSVRHKLESMVCGVRCYQPKTLLMLLILETGTIVIGYVFCEYRLYLHILHCANIPQLSSIPKVNPPHQSWCHEHAPTLVSSISYTLLHVSSYVAHHQYSKQTLLVDHWLSTPLPLLLQSCMATTVLSMWLHAVFGSTVVTNSVTMQLNQHHISRYVL